MGNVAHVVPSGEHKTRKALAAEAKVSDRTAQDVLSVSWRC